MGITSSISVKSLHDASQNTRLDMPRHLISRLSSRFVGPSRSPVTPVVIMKYIFGICPTAAAEENRRNRMPYVGLRVLEMLVHLISVLETRSCLSSLGMRMTHDPLPSIVLQDLEAGRVRHQLLAVCRRQSCRDLLIHTSCMVLIMAPRKETSALVRQNPFQPMSQVDFP